MLTAKETTEFAPRISGRLQRCLRMRQTSLLATDVALLPFSGALREEPFIDSGLRFAIFFKLLLDSVVLDELLHLLGLTAAAKEGGSDGRDFPSTRFENRRKPHPVPSGNLGLSFGEEPFTAITALQCGRCHIDGVCDSRLLLRECDCGFSQGPQRGLQVTTLDLFADAADGEQTL